MTTADATPEIISPALAWHAAIVAVIDLAGSLRDVMRDGDPDAAAAAEKTTRDLAKIFEVSLRVAGKERSVNEDVEALRGFREGVAALTASLGIQLNGEIRGVVRRIGDPGAVGFSLLLG